MELLAKTHTIRQFLSKGHTYTYWPLNPKDYNAGLKKN